MKKETESSPCPLTSNPSLADIVISLNGRDAQKLFVVIETDKEYSLIADGKGRRFEKPKRKKNKHLRVDSKVSGVVAEKLAAGEKPTNNELRRALAAHVAENAAKEVCDNAKR